MGKREIDKTRCTVIYQGQEADLDDKAAVTALITPMFEEIHQRRGAPMKPRQQFLLVELEPTAIQLAQLVGQFAALEEEKKATNQDFKERMDLLKMQIKRAAKTINEGMAGAGKGGESAILGATLGADPALVRAVASWKKAEHPELP